ncbi:LytR/AlgR family response regulator transcription factor [Saccharibacillus alkalitolerans]|uniref:Response regulator n=1 Tax=Saccharibacillus alkalitolerans TaxID=2705290 RepID=A0ABX0F7F9_9BACL|nr:response regulator [Saccharibacillus alkalitolerans]NGZ76315.1 response regulator [Saccharibacillus alkalitolerans]
MRIYVLDGDPEALARTAGLLGSYPYVKLVGSSSDPSVGLNEAIRLAPDVLFVDTHLGSLSGLAASDRLKRELPRLHVVYVTESREYAVEAFEQGAFDYLIKPLLRERLERTLGRMKLFCGGSFSGNGKLDLPDISHLRQDGGNDGCGQC